MSQILQDNIETVEHNIEFPVFQISELSVDVCQNAGRLIFTTTLKMSNLSLNHHDRLTSQELSELLLSYLKKCIEDAERDGFVVSHFHQQQDGLEAPNCGLSDSGCRRRTSSMTKKAQTFALSKPNHGRMRS